MVLGVSKLKQIRVHVLPIKKTCEKTAQTRLALTVGIWPALLFLNFRHNSRNIRKRQSVGHVKQLLEFS